jgi:succinate dehydrogenase / fumarate reductase cytochrome b subunit
VKVKEGYKDLYKLTSRLFRDANMGPLVYYILCVIHGGRFGFHHSMDFSGFQTLGAKPHPKYNLIKMGWQWWRILSRWPLFFYCHYSSVYGHFSK